MGENKKYYWLKLMNDFFTQPRIKKLRKIAGGDTYTIIYLKLQLLSLKTNGVLVFEGIEDNVIEELALTIDEDVDNVQVTFNFLVKQGLIEPMDDASYLMTETQYLIGSETQVAKRVRKHRESKKLLQCNTDVTDCNTEIDIDKDIELEIDKEVEEEKKKKETFVSLIEAYTTDPQLVSILKQYVEMRKKMKGFTTHALKLNLNTLSKLSNDDVTKVAIVEQSIEHSWKSFYELKIQPKSKEIMPEWTKQKEEEPSKDEHLEKLRILYRIKKMDNDQTEMEKYKIMYFDLTQRDIEQDI